LGAGSVSEAGTEEAHPGPIDNSDLMDPLAPSELKKHMIEEMNYCMVPADIWNPMQEQFGLVEGQEPLPRTVRYKHSHPLQFAFS